MIAKKFKGVELEKFNVGMTILIRLRTNYAQRQSNKLIYRRLRVVGKSMRNLGTTRVEVRSTCWTRRPT